MIRKPYHLEPKLNGGLYTGEPFEKHAQWGVVPVIPDVDYMTHINLRSANPPVEAIYQYPGNVRPGNNSQVMPGVENNKKLAMACNNNDLCGVSFSKTYYSGFEKGKTFAPY